MRSISIYDCCVECDNTIYLLGVAASATKALSSTSRTAASKPRRLAVGESILTGGGLQTLSVVAQTQACARETRRASFAECLHTQKARELLRLRWRPTYGATQNGRGRALLYRQADTTASKATRATQLNPAPNSWSRPGSLQALANRGKARVNHLTTSLMQLCDMSLPGMEFDVAVDDRFAKPQNIQSRWLSGSPLQCLPPSHISLSANIQQPQASAARCCACG